MSLANQDGGAHVDAVLKAPYEGLSREVTLKWEGGITSPGSPVPAGVRQIAHELMWTLDRELLRLLPNDFRSRESPGICDQESTVEPIHDGARPASIRPIVFLRQAPRVEAGEHLPPACHGEGQAEHHREQ